MTPAVVGLLGLAVVVLVALAFWRLAHADDYDDVVYEEVEEAGGETWYDEEPYERREER